MKDDEIEELNLSEINRFLDFLNKAETVNEIAGVDEHEIRVDLTRKLGRPRELQIELEHAEILMKKKLELDNKQFSNIKEIMDIKIINVDIVRYYLGHFSHASLGKWEEVEVGNNGIFGLHAALLNTGKVILWSGSAEHPDINPYPWFSKLFNPTLGVLDPDTNLPKGELEEGRQLFDGINNQEDPFCAGHTFLADGKLLVTGGAITGTSRGIMVTHIFDPESETWGRKADMKYGRWYPTLILRHDGKVIAFSGWRELNSFSRVVAGQAELYDPSTNRWCIFGEGFQVPIYPSLHLLPTGDIFYSGTSWASSAASPLVTTYLWSEGGHWTALGSPQQRQRTEGMATLAPPVNDPRVLLVGGRTDADELEMINLSTLNPLPQWPGIVHTMINGRSNCNLTVLPDETVLISGGVDVYKWNAESSNWILECEIFDPNVSPPTFTRAASQKYPRQYHSTTILLPDGRVLSAGGINPQGDPVDQVTMEVFSPPYLFKGERPVINSAPTFVSYEEGFICTYTSTKPITKAVLARPGSITHHTDTDQRIIRLDSTIISSESIQITAPDSALTPPGCYMLFLLNDSGVPSIAKFLTIGKEIASDHVGDFTVVWQDDKDKNGYYQIYGRGFSTQIDQRFHDKALNSVASGQQIKPQIGMASNGDFVVVWQDDKDKNGYWQILARGFDKRGDQRIADFTVNSVASGQQVRPDISMNQNGEFVVVWQDDKDKNGYWQIFAKGYDPDGGIKFNDITVNSISKGQQFVPKVSIADNGDFVVVWQDDKDKNGYYQILARGFHANGTQKFSDRTINSVAKGQQLLPDIAMASNGDFVVVWEDDKNENGYYQIFAKVYYSSGSVKISDFTVNSVSSGQQYRPRVAMNSVGNFVVVWQDDKDKNGYYQIYARGFNSNGTENFHDMTVNSVSSGQQYKPDVAISSDSDFVVVWQDDKDKNGYYQIYARGFNANGTEKFEDLIVNCIADGQQLHPAIALRNPSTLKKLPWPITPFFKKADPKYRIKEAMLPIDFEWVDKKTKDREQQKS